MIYYLVLLLFAVEYLRPGNVWPVVNVFRLNTIIPLLVLALTAVTGAVPNRDVFRDRNFSILLALLGLITMSVLTARVTAYAFEAFTTVLGYVLFTWVVARQMGDVSRLKGLFKTMIGIHIVILAIAPEIVTDASTRHYIPAGAFLGDGNDFALSVCILVPFALFLLFESPKWRQKAFYIALLLLLVAAIVGTQSRGGSLGLIAVVIYYWWQTDRKVLTGALAVTALVGVMALASPQYFARMGTIVTYETDGSAQGRLTAWQAGVGMMLSNPLLGVGAGNFPPNFTRFAPGAGGVGRWKTAHSIYFLILGELGLPGFFLLIYFIGWNLNANRRLSKQLRGQGVSARSSEVRLLGCLSASLIAFAVAGAFLSAVYYPHMFVLAGMLAAARQIARATVAVPVAAAPVRVPAVASLAGAAAHSPRPIRVMSAEASDSRREMPIENGKKDGKLNVLILASALCIGGAESVIQHLATSIDRRRFNVLVRYIKEAGQIGEELERDGIDVARLEGVGPRGVDYLTSVKLRRVVRAAGIDVIHTHTPPGLFDAGLCRMVLPRLRVVHTFHFGNYPHTRPGILWMERIGSRLVDRLLAVGEVQRDQIRRVHRLGDRAIGTVWNGVRPSAGQGDPDFRRSVGAEGRVLVGTIATLITQKGLFDLLETARKVRDAGFDAKFVICGEGRLRPALEARRRELALDDVVALPGWVNRAAETALPVFDIFFQPSLWEAMSMVTLEAMAAAKPVVVTAVGEAPRIITHGVDGLVVPPRDVAAMAEAIVRLLRDEALRRQLGTAARATVLARFTVDHMARAYERIYQDMFE